MVFVTLTTSDSKITLYFDNPIINPVAISLISTTFAAEMSSVLKTGDTMSGQLAMSGNKTTNVDDPESSFDVATKNYIDSLLSQYTRKAVVYTTFIESGDIMTIPIPHATWTTAIIIVQLYQIMKSISIYRNNTGTFQITAYGNGRAAQAHQDLSVNVMEKKLLQ